MGGPHGRRRTRLAFRVMWIEMLKGIPWGRL
jgi:hypothetical protein